MMDRDRFFLGAPTNFDTPQHRQKQQKQHQQQQQLHEIHPFQKLFYKTQKKSQDNNKILKRTVKTKTTAASSKEKNVRSYLNCFDNFFS